MLERWSGSATWLLWALNHRRQHHRHDEGSYRRGQTTHASLRQRRQHRLPSTSRPCWQTLTTTTISSISEQWWWRHGPRHRHRCTRHWARTIIACGRAIIVRFVWLSPLVTCPFAVSAFTLLSRITSGGYRHWSLVTIVPAAPTRRLTDVANLSFLLPATVCHHADPSGQTLIP